MQFCKFFLILSLDRGLFFGCPHMHVCAFINICYEGHGRGFYFQFTCGFNPFVLYHLHTKFPYMQNSFNLLGKRALSSSCCCWMGRKNFSSFQTRYKTEKRSVEITLTWHIFLAVWHKLTIIVGKTFLWWQKFCLSKWFQCVIKKHAT